jgi:hypothetical protein
MHDHVRVPRLEPGQWRTGILNFCVGIAGAGIILCAVAIVVHEVWKAAGL